jgi:hypothetical protein
MPANPSFENPFETKTTSNSTPDSAISGLLGIDKNLLRKAGFDVENDSVETKPNIPEGIVYAELNKAPKSIEINGKEFPVITLELSGKSGPELLKDIKAEEGMSVTSSVESILNSGEFTASPKGEIVNLVTLKVSDLGFKATATYSAIVAKAKEYGLELCPKDTGPNYRLEYTDQPDGWITIFSEAMAASDGNPRVFSLRRDGVAMELYGDWAGPDDLWSPDHEVVFRLKN